MRTGHVYFVLFIPYFSEYDMLTSHNIKHVKKPINSCVLISIRIVTTFQFTNIDARNTSSLLSVQYITHTY